tara:strand:+ start:208 stop:567 length:360 start_codon:yes stop_codon:yes gene_type:complete
MDENTRAFIEELKAKAKHKAENGPIDMTADQLWKYSGEVEPTDFEKIQEYEHDTRFRYFKKTIKGKDLSIFLSKRDNLIVDYFYRNHNHTMEKMSQDLGISVVTIRTTMERYLKLKRKG